MTASEGGGKWAPNLELRDQNTLNLPTVGLSEILRGLLGRAAFEALSFCGWCFQDCGDAADGNQTVHNHVGTCREARRHPRVPEPKVVCKSHSQSNCADSWTRWPTLGFQAHQQMPGRFLRRFFEGSTRP